MKSQSVKKFLLSALKTLSLPVVVFIIFAVLTGGRFANSRILLTTMKQSITPAIICLGLMLTFTVGNMNFSAGAVVLCSTIIGGNLMKMTNSGIVGLILFTIAIALTLSVITGFLYIKMRIPSIVLTIGLVLIFESLPRAFFEGGVTIPGKLTYLATPPYNYVVLLIVIVAFYIIFNNTAFGHNIRALGNNQEIANKVGLDSDKIKFVCFVISGAFLGIAAILYGSAAGEVRNVGALGSMAIMMDAFMGVFLAGFLSRFCNTTFGVIVGSFTMKMITNGFVALGLSATIRDITTGLMLFILLAVSANQGMLERRKSDKQNAQIANEKYQKKLSEN
jgi:ribose transport system permease protein